MPVRVGRYRAMSRNGRSLLLAHPFDYAAIHVLRLLLEPGAVDYFKQFGAYSEGDGLLGLVVDRGMIAALQTLLAERPPWCFSRRCSSGRCSGVCLRSRRRCGDRRSRSADRRSFPRLCGRVSRRDEWSWTRDKPAAGAADAAARHAGRVHAVFARACANTCRRSLRPVNFNRCCR